MTTESDKPVIQTTDHIEMADSKDLEAPVPVHSDVQTRICSKDRKMLPILCALYVLSYLDRGNIGNAKTAGIMEDLQLGNSDWVWVLQVFYICYVLFEWTQLFWKILPAHIYVATLCFL
jgi:hypothetical protein